MVPIQLKAATTASFSIERKYARVDPLVMVYVWNVRSAGAAHFYALAWPQAIAVGDALKWTQTKSWREKGNIRAQGQAPACAAQSSRSA
jgi:hypothetical protein